MKKGKRIWGGIVSILAIVLLSLLVPGRAVNSAPYRNISSVRGGFFPLSGFDSLNVSYVGNWPFAAAFAIASDFSRNLVFLGSGGGIYILDISQICNPVKLSESIHTRGIFGESYIDDPPYSDPAPVFFSDFFYDQSSQLLYVGATAGGMEIWDVSDPEEPEKITAYFTAGYPANIFVSGSYAFVADYEQGLRILNISNPSNPYEEGFFECYHITKVKVLGDYAYALNFSRSEYEPGLLIVDVSDVNNPTFVDSVNGIGGGLFDIYLSYPYAYICNGVAGMFYVVNISDPEDPYIEGSLSTYPFGDPLAIDKRDNLVYVACDHGLCIISVVYPYAPRKLSDYGLEHCNSDIIFYSDEAMEEDYVFLAGCWNGMLLFNVSDSTDPYLCPQGDFPTPANSYSVFKKDHYVYVASSSFLEIIDIEDISQPKEVGSLYFEPPEKLCRDVFVEGNLAYVGGFDRFSIVDVSNPATPQIEGFLNLGFSIYEILVRDNFAYVVGGLGTDGYFQIIDVSDPEHPEMKGDICDGWGIVDFCIVDNYAYVCWEPESLRIVDISDPDFPELLESFHIDGGAWGVDVSGNYLYLAGIEEGLRIFDISDPLDPVEISSIATTDWVTHVKILDNYVYAATMGPRVIVFDVSNPYDPLEVGFYMTPGFSFGVDASEGFIYVADYNGGLQIYQNLLLPSGIDDPLSLAYNGNKHLVREPNTDNLHLVYTDAGNVLYRYSESGGKVWSMVDNLGEGSLPALALDSDNNPLITWANGNYLLFRKKNPGQGWVQTQYTFETLQPSHPSIVVTRPELVDLDTVHILVRLSRSLRPYNAIKELSFPLTNPQNYHLNTIDSSYGGNMIALEFPSVAKDYENTLHATWMHGDTIYYGIREEGASTWDVWGNKFSDQGIQSTHPFVETYGDSIFVVWQNESDDEVYRGARYLQYLQFYWANLSQTSTTPSIYPVNASGLVTTFVDKSSVSSEYDIFWRTYPSEPSYNLSNSPFTKSIFPQTAIWILEEPDLPIQYTAWLEGNSSPYEIKCNETIIDYDPGKGRGSVPIPAYFTSIPGSATPSLYLAKRDSFITNWQIPIDVGYEEVSYQFPLEPNYKYRLKATAYHEKEDKWKMKIAVDGEEMGEIEYAPYTPETLECSIPEEFYKDSLIEVTFACDDGNFAAVGPVYIYRFEYGEGKRSGGSMSSGIAPNGERTLLCLSPNPFRDRIRIDLMLAEKARVKVAIYDVTGRLVKSIYKGMISGKAVLNWDGDNKNGRSVSQGVYFLRIHNLDTDEAFSRKMIKLH